MPVEVRDTDYLPVTDDVHVTLHQGTRHSRHGETPGPPPPVPAAPRGAFLAEVTGPRRTKRRRLPPAEG